MHGKGRAEPAIAPIGVAERSEQLLEKKRVASDHLPAGAQGLRSWTLVHPPLDLLRDEEAAARARALGPSSIGRAVLGRLASMWPDALALARSVAIVGADAEHRAAAELAGLEIDRAHEAADALVAAHVFAAAHGPLRFAHPILRQAVYSDIPRGAGRSNTAVRH